MTFQSIILFITIEWEKVPKLVWLLAGAAALFLFVWLIYSVIQRLKGNPVRGRKLTFRERLQPRKARLLLSKVEGSRGKVVTLAVQNTGRRPVDLEMPVLIFKRWTSSRKFRLNAISGFDDFPIWLEPEYEAKWDIELEKFFTRIPELKRACRISIEMKEVSGKRFISRDLRLKWF